MHGRGYVARLSGSTAEWISIVFHMALGVEPFRFVGGQLRFEPSPTIAKWLFTKKAEGDFEKDTFAVKLFGKTWIVYYNPQKRDTYAGKGLRPVRYRVRYENGRELVHEGKSLPDRLARDLRQGQLSRLTIDLAETVGRMLK